MDRRRPAVIADEVAFWRAEDSANPADEILAALRPGLATIPGAPLLAISSPYSRSGPLWTAYERHYGRDDSDVLVIQAPTLALNPTVPKSLIDRAYEEDPQAAAAEWGAEFRREVEAFLSREAIAACVVPGRLELPPVAGVRYVGFCDPSGGSQDSMTLGIAHRDGDRAVLDVVRERRPPFSPDDVVAEFAATLKLYDVSAILGDRYAGSWVSERFKQHGICYEPAEQAKSDIYRDFGPIVNAQRVELLDLPRFRAQLVGLERRTARGGRDSIDHGPRAHDDLGNAAAGAVTLALARKRGVTWADLFPDADAQAAAGAFGDSDTFESRWGFVRG